MWRNSKLPVFFIKSKKNLFSPTVFLLYLSIFSSFLLVPFRFCICVLLFPKQVLAKDAKNLEISADHSEVIDGNYLLTGNWL
jgi:hypothetical protein